MNGSTKTLMIVLLCCSILGCSPKVAQETMPAIDAGVTSTDSTSGLDEESADNGTGAADTYEDVEEDTEDAAQSKQCSSLWTAKGKASKLALVVTSPGDSPQTVAIGCGDLVERKADGTVKNVAGVGYATVSATGKVNEITYTNSIEVGNFGVEISRCPAYYDGLRFLWGGVPDVPFTATGPYIYPKFRSFVLRPDGTVKAFSALPSVVGNQVGVHVRSDGYMAGLAIQMEPVGSRQAWMFTGKAPSPKMNAKSSLGPVDGVGMTDSLLAPDGGLYLHGFVEQGNTTKATRVMRLGSDGKKLWSVQVDANAAWGRRTMAWAHGDGVVVAGGECDCMRSFRVYSFGLPSLSFEHVSSKGVVMTKRSLTFPDGSGMTSSLAKGSTGYVLLTSVAYPQATQSSARVWRAGMMRSLLWKLDKKGNVMWNRYVHPTDQTSFAFLPSIWNSASTAPINDQRYEHTTITGAFPTPDNHIILVGRVPNANNITLSHAWFRRLGPHGEQDCDKKDLCIGVKTTIDCDDGDPCTTDVCQPDKGCVHLPRPVMSWCGGDLTTNYEYDCEPCDFGPTYKACQLPEGKSSGKLECSWVPYKLIAAPGEGTEACKPMCPSSNGG